MSFLVAPLHTTVVLTAGGRDYVWRGVPAGQKLCVPGAGGSDDGDDSSTDDEGELGDSGSEADSDWEPGSEAGSDGVAGSDGDSDAGGDGGADDDSSVASFGEDEADGPEEDLSLMRYGITVHEVEEEPQRACRASDEFLGDFCLEICPKKCFPFASHGALRQRLSSTLRLGGGAPPAV